MAKALHIKKIKEENRVYYYEVSERESDYPTKFVIAIDAEKKIISYFLDIDCAEPVTIIDFNKTGIITPVAPWEEWPASSAFFLAGIQALKAIRSNNFPEHMGIYS